MSLREKDSSYSSVKKNRESNFALDVNSIMDQLMGSEGLDDLSDDEERIKKQSQSNSSPSRSPNIISNKQKSSPSPKISEELPKYSLRSSKSKPAKKNSTSLEQEELNEKKPPLSPWKQPIEDVHHSKTNSIVKNRQSSEMKHSPHFSKLQNINVSHEEEDQLKTKGMVSQNHRGRKEALSNGHLTEHDNDDFRIRARSNAINKYDRLKVHARDGIKKDMLEEERSQEAPRKKNRPTSTNVVDSSVSRSGSFNRRQQMSGDKALGMFYHSRHSQLIDLETLDESEKLLRGSSLERSGSFNDPRSPTSRSRDSKSFSPIPQSPLISQNQTFEADEKLSHVGKGKTSETHEAATLLSSQDKLKMEEPEVMKQSFSCGIYLLIILGFEHC